MTLRRRCVGRGGRQEPRKTHPHLGSAARLRGPQPPAAARRKLCAALRAAPGTRRRCSRTAPPRAALPAAACSKASAERTGVAARGGAAATFSPPPLSWVRTAVGARLGPRRPAPPHPYTQSWSAGLRCDYASAGGAIILNARRKELERLERIPNSMPLGRESSDTHKIRTPLDPSV